MGEFLLFAEVAGAVLTIFALIAAIRTAIKWARRITMGALCQLRSDMLRTYYKHRESNQIRQYELENFIKCYEAYRSLGGNSFVTDVYETVMDWDIVP
jgi:hypothetical protein